MIRLQKLFPNMISRWMLTQILCGGDYVPSDNLNCFTNVEKGQFAAVVILEICSRNSITFSSGALKALIFPGAISRSTHAASVNRLV